MKESAYQRLLRAVRDVVHNTSEDEGGGYCVDDDRFTELENAWKEAQTEEDRRIAKAVK